MVTKKSSKTGELDKSTAHCFDMDKCTAPEAGESNIAFLSKKNEKHSEDP